MQYDRERSRPTGQSSPHVEIRGLTKRYGALAALDAVDLAVNKGELFSLVGSSGCGKTTLLRAIAGFVRPDAGQILIGDRDMAALEPYDRPVNMMFQSYALFPHMSVADNIAFGLRREHLAGGEIRKRVGDALALIQMSDFARRRPHQLSGGQRQRVALARAIVKRPQVLLLDEPLSALDRKLRESTQFELMHIQDQLGITFIMVTHDQEEAMTMSSRIAVMSEGRILQIGTPREIYERPVNRFVADFVGSVNLFEGVVVADSEGLATLRCDSLGTMLASNSIGAPVGAQLAIGIRPERVVLSRPGANDALQNSVPGRIASVAFTGDRRVYQVAVAAGDGRSRLLKVSEPNAAGDDRLFARGEDVEVGWNANASLLLQP